MRYHRACPASDKSEPLKSVHDRVPPEARLRVGHTCRLRSATLFLTFPARREKISKNLPFDSTLSVPRYPIQGSVFFPRYRNSREALYLICASSFIQRAAPFISFKWNLLWRSNVFSTRLSAYRGGLVRIAFCEMCNRLVTHDKKKKRNGGNATAYVHFITPVSITRR